MPVISRRHCLGVMIDTCLDIYVQTRKHTAGPPRRADYNSLATQLLNNANMEARISSVVRNIFIQMNFSTSTKDPKDFVKDRMDAADLTDEKIINKLGSVVGDNSSFFNLTISEDENVHYHIDIVNRLCTKNQFRCLIFILGLRSPCHAEIRLRLLSLLDKKPDVTKCRRRLESAGGLGRCHYRGCLIEDVAARTAMTMATKKTSTENLLQTVQRGKTRKTREHKLRRGRAMIDTGSDI
ncbi:hypothetical protein ACTXT7_006478 [Hymenolepis weldensis]